MVKLSAKYIPTGRIVTAGDDHGKVNEWVKLQTKEELLNHDVAKEFLNAISELKPLTKDDNIFYRGRKFENELEFPNNSLKMGPPTDLNLIVADRYNNDKESVLYLADSIFGIQNELDSRLGTLWYQKFIVPFSKMKIIDLTSTPQESLITSIMFECEVAGNEYRCTKIFSQSTADIIKQVADGFLTHGVRGDNDNNYKNLVLFNQIDTWTNWIDNNDKPIQY